MPGQSLLYLEFYRPFKCFCTYELHFLIPVNERFLQMSGLSYKDYGKQLFICAVLLKVSIHIANDLICERFEGILAYRGLLY